MLTLRGAKIKDVTSFITRSTQSSDPDAYTRFPEQPMAPDKLRNYFERFGLPARLD